MKVQVSRDADTEVDLTWATRANRSSLLQLFGSATFARGEAYARDSAVHEIVISDSGRTVSGTVRGSGRLPYRTAVRIPPAFPHARVTSSCTCPMRVDCKHVVALLLVACRVAVSVPTGQAPPWEATLAALVEDGAATQGSAVPLALSFEQIAPTRARDSATGPRLRLRPVRPGSNGRWITTGASWRDVEYGYARPAFVDDHRDALLRLLRYARAQRSRYSYGQETLHLDEVGPLVWPLLHTARRAGVRFVQPGRHAGSVHLHEQPARLVVDASRDGGGRVLLTAGLRAHDGSSMDADGVVVTGDPAHGFWCRRDDDLLLAALARPLPAAVTSWVTGGQPLRVPAAEVPRLLTRYYPALSRHAGFESTDGTVTPPRIHAPRLALTVAFGEAHTVRLTWSFIYQVDDAVTRVRLAGPSPEIVRDEAVEQRLTTSAELLDVLDAVPGAVTGVGPTRRLAPETALSGWATLLFTRDVLPRLRRHDDVLVDVLGTAPDFQEVRERPVVTLAVSDDGASTDWFNLSVTVRVGDRDVPFASLFAALGRGDEHLLLDDGAWFHLRHPELHRLRALIEQSRDLVDPDRGTLRVSPYQAGLWEELLSLGVVQEQSDRWRRTVAALLQHHDAPPPSEPDGLHATLRPYQRQGFEWLCVLWDLGLGGVLADDMGLGKTLQTLAMVQRAVEQGTATAPVLIIAPTSVVSTWVSEAARFTPGLRVAAVTETTRRSGTPLREHAADAHVVVTSYALLRIDRDAYLARSWSGLVLDEAQFVKNHRTSTYQCARRIRAPFKLAITGTPLENSLMDLWSLLSIAAPGLFADPEHFAETYRKPIEAGGAPELLAALRRRIRPLMMRRTKEQVAPELPPKQDQVLTVTLNPRHEKIYQTHLQRERQRVLGMLDDMQRNRIAILRSLTVLRQLSLDPSLVDERHAGKVRPSKVDVLLEQLAEVAAEGHRALVFSQFTGFLKVVRTALDEAGIAYCYLDGRTRDRPRRIAEFTDGSAPVFLISLKAGGFGLTLTEADYVFVLDPWWNPAAEQQAVDRTHRIGQDKTVMVYRLVAADTIEEKVVALQERKRALFSQVVDDGDAMAGPLTADDIKALLAS